jgi:hypothetical protein
VGRNDGAGLVFGLRLSCSQLGHCNIWMEDHGNLRAVLRSGVRSGSSFLREMPQWVRLN